MKTVELTANELTVDKKGLWEYRKMVIREFLKNRLAVLGFIITSLMIVIAIFGPLFTSASPYEMNAVQRLAAPSTVHVFGTDTLGRDLFTRVIYGLRVSMVVGFMTALASCILGIVLGLLSGYFSFLDDVIMRICDGLMAIPAILMAIVMMASLGATIVDVIFSLVVVYTPRVARIARAMTLSVKEQTYIEAIQALGASWPRILFFHIAPNILSPVIVQTTYIFASSIIIEAALSFLGAGVPAPDPSLGNILFDAKGVIFKSWWMTAFPGAFMMLTVFGVNIFGDGLRDLLDPLSN